jgi:general secretion pathway protein G
MRFGKIGVLAAAAICISCGGGDQKPRIEEARAKIDKLTAGLKTYKRDVGSYPSASQGLAALAEKPAGVETWKGPYVEGGKLPFDPWGHAFFYVADGPYVGSYGADGIPGGDGPKTDLMTRIIEEQR